MKRTNRKRSTKSVRKTASKSRKSRRSQKGAKTALRRTSKRAAGKTKPKKPSKRTAAKSRGKKAARKAAAKKTAPKKTAPKKAAPKKAAPKKAAPKKAAPKKAARKSLAPRKSAAKRSSAKGSGAQTPRRLAAVVARSSRDAWRGVPSYEPPDVPEWELGPDSGGQSGDLEGLSHRSIADSESVAELIEEGQSFEAGIVAGVENAPSGDQGGVTTREVPEDDVPPEYYDQ